jgi:hypothetical protein
LEQWVAKNGAASAVTVVVLACLMVLSPGVLAGIGLSIPDERLPLVEGRPRYTVWQDAGCLSRLRKSSIRIDRRVNLVGDCGAVANDGGDDTAAFEKALRRAVPDELTMIDIPAGRYRVTRQLNLPSGVIIKGAGALATELCFTVTGTCLEIVGCQRTGIENLKLTRDDAESKNRWFLRFSAVRDCWVRGVETAVAHSNHIAIGGGSRNVEIRGCYIHDATDHGGGGNGYGVLLGGQTNRCLVENNVFRRLRHAILTGGKAHWNVCGYNAMFENYTETSGPGIPVWCAGDIELHGNAGAPASGGAYENLFEGNYANLIWIDAYWGDNGPGNTFVRNVARQGGLLLESRSNTRHGGLWENCNNRQNFLNNFLVNTNWRLRVRYGAPWGDGQLLGLRIGGQGHWVRNNLVWTVSPFFRKKRFWEANGPEQACLKDASYYHATKPSFMSVWPYDPLCQSRHHPAAQRFLGGGPVTVPVGPAGYE